MDRLYGSLGEPGFSENALTILKRRYLHKDDEGKVIETPKEMLYRVAKTIANVDLGYNFSKNDATTRKFYDVMANGYFLPNSPTLRGAGINSNLAACFALPVADSRKSIFKTLQDASEIQAFGGGTGFNFSELRPNGSIISSTKGYSRGPLPFIEVFDKVTGEVIAQGGVRQGANMGILNYNHPDIMQFIRYKSTLNEKHMKLVQDFKDESGIGEDSEYLRVLERVIVRNLQLRNFNLSVGITEDFMMRAKEGRDYELINHKNKVVGKLNAKQVLEEIIQSAWKTGDPGIIFLDRIDRDNPTPALGKIVSTNPCAEQPLLPYEACNLGSINLAKMVSGKAVNYGLLGKTVDAGVHLLDNVIDANSYVVPEIEEMVKGNRKIGMGVMGFADMLIQLGVPYASEEGLSFARDVMKFINERAYEASCGLARKKGSFPNFGQSVYSGKTPIRNATRTTIAPTGTLSTLLDVSSGIEPIYAINYTRGSIYNPEGKATEELVVTNTYLEKILRENRVDYNRVMEDIRKSGSIQDVKGVPSEIKRLFLTANEIPVDIHVRMQGAFQEFVDNAVSKTINLRAGAQVDDVAKAHWMAYELGNIKGLTVYRDGSKGSQVLTALKQEKSPLEGMLEGKPLRGRNVPSVKWLPGATFQANTGCGPLFVTLTADKHGIVEVFNNMNPPGGCAAAQTAASGILASLGLQEGVDPKKCIKHLRAIACPPKNDLVGQMSCSQAMANVMEEFNEIMKALPEDYTSRFLSAADKVRDGKDRNGTGHQPTPINNKSGFNLVDALCPECHSALQFGEGCKGGKCVNCGYSNCG